MAMSNNTLGDSDGIMIAWSGPLAEPGWNCARSNQATSIDAILKFLRRNIGATLTH